MTRKFDGTELLIATHNPGKAAEFQKMLGEAITVKMASDVGLPDVEETGTTYAENAELKAQAGAQYAGIPTLGDDSGFGIDALGGKPGLYSARFMKAQGGYGQAFDALQEELGDQDRTVRFTTALCLAWPDGHIEMVEEHVLGQFIYPPRGSGGFGYDPVFMRNGDTQTFGELPEGEKNPRSARGQAVRAMLEKCFS